jgi:hypothetical protein
VRLLAGGMAARGGGGKERRLTGIVMEWRVRNFFSRRCYEKVYKAELLNYRLVSTASAIKSYFTPWIFLKPFKLHPAVVFKTVQITPGFRRRICYSNYGFASAGGFDFFPIYFR